MVKPGFRIKKYFNEADFSEIENTICDAEKKSAAEFVVVIADHTNIYQLEIFTYALFGSLASVIFFWAGQWLNPFAEASSIVGGISTTVIFTLLFYVANYFKKIYWGNRQNARLIWEKAVVQFYQHKISNTKYRTGVLLYFSLHERSVQIVTDYGIGEKLGQSYWDDTAKNIASGFKGAKPKQAICAAISSIGDSVKGHFPMPASNENEISNKVIIV